MRASGKKPEVALQIELVRRHPQDNAGWCPGRIAYGSRMAHRAIQAYESDLSSPVTRTNRTFAPLRVICEAQSLVAVSWPLWEQIRKHFGQDGPDAVGHARSFFSPDGAVLEMLNRVCVPLRLIPVEKLEGKHGSHQAPDEDPSPRAASDTLLPDPG